MLNKISNQIFQVKLPKKSYELMKAYCWKNELKINDYLKILVEASIIKNQEDYNSALNDRNEYIKSKYTAKL